MLKALGSSVLQGEADQDQIAVRSVELGFPPRHLSGDEEVR